MKYLTFAPLLIAIAGCEQSSDDLPMRSERTFKHIQMATGSYVYEAIRLVNGIPQVETSRTVNTPPPSGMVIQSVHFPDCGRVTLISLASSSDMVRAVHSGVGLTRDCQIRNWDGDWRIVRT